MADLLSSSSDEDEAPGVWRNARAPRGSAIAVNDVAAVDLLTPAVARPADGSSRMTNNPLFKPVISARELLKQFLPAKAKASIPTTSLRDVSSYQKSSTAMPAVSPYRLVERAERKDTREPSAQVKASLTVNMNVQREKAPASASSVYVSPFGRENDPQLKRRRQSLSPAPASASWKAQKEDSTWRRQSLSNDSARRRASGSDEAKPMSVNASSLLLDDDDDWLSDTNEKEEKRTEQAQAKEPSRPSVIEQPRLQAQPSRKRQRPRSESESSLPDEERWPRLPPRDVCFAAVKVFLNCSLICLLCKQTNDGPLVLSESPHLVQVCANMNNYLFDYQREGVQFMYDAYARGTGAILGDDMGLGKTIQVIALLAAIRQKQGDYHDKEIWRRIRNERRERQFEAKEEDVQTFCSLDGSAAPILIVVPASLLHNWESEINVWMSCCTVLLHGKPEERDSIIHRILRYVAFS